MSRRGGYVGRGGLKLEHALRAFDVDVSGAVCADLGCSTGGFTDCLLKHGAVRVHAVDTGYGVLDYSLRIDERVCVHERTNALHVEPPELVGLVTIDLGWTRQGKAIPAALGWLSPGGRIITLVKPVYELTNEERREHLREGVIPPDFARAVAMRTCEAMEPFARVVDITQSPIAGGATRGKKTGNLEWLAYIEPGGGP